MDSFEPVDIDYDKIGDEDYKWDVIKNLEVRFNPINPGLLALELTLGGGVFHPFP